MAPRYEYRVLSQKDRWFMGRIDPDKLAIALNELAADGWRVVSSATQGFHEIIRGQRDEILIILEREWREPVFEPVQPRAPKVEAPPVMLPCPKCGKDIDSKATRCLHCMAEVTRRCPFCSSEMPAHLAKCPRCDAMSVPRRK